MRKDIPLRFCCVIWCLHSLVSLAAQSLLSTRESQVNANSITARQVARGALVNKRFQEPHRHYRRARYSSVYLDGVDDGLGSLLRNALQFGATRSATTIQSTPQVTLLRCYLSDDRCLYINFVQLSFSWQRESYGRRSTNEKGESLLHL